MDSYLKIALEIIKALTPFILALIVYFIWHKQKEKEVIATEAKNSIALLNAMSTANDELYEIMRDMIDVFHNYDDTHKIHIDFNDKLDELDKKRLEIFYSALFICDAKKDVRLERYFVTLDAELKSTLSKLRIFFKKINMRKEVEELKQLASKYNHNLIVENYAYKKILLEIALYRK